MMRVRSPVACVAMALVAGALAPSAAASASASTAAGDVEIRQWPMGRIFPLQAGDFLADYRLQIAVAEPFPLAFVDTLGGERKLADLRTMISGLQPDDLARCYLASTFEVLSLLRLASIRLGDAPSQRIVALTAPDGAAISLPLPQAIAYAKAAAILAAKALRDAPSPPLVAGTFQVSTAGDCPITAGPVELQQNGPVFEGVRDEAPLLVGSLGGRTASVRLPDRSFAETRRDRRQRSLAIRYPATPARSFSGLAGGGTLELAPDDASTCRLTLSPAP